MDRKPPHACLRFSWTRTRFDCLLCLRHPLWEGATLYHAYILDRLNMGIHYYLQIWRCAVTGLVLCAVPE